MKEFLAIMTPIVLITLGLWFYFSFRNNRVLEFRRCVIDAMFKSKYWLELVNEFDKVDYNAMFLSFKPLRMERWFSKDFCEKIKL